MEHPRLAHLQGQTAIQLVFQFVNVILRAPFTEIVHEFFIVAFQPPLDFAPGVSDGRGRRCPVVEALHLNLGGTVRLVIRPSFLRSERSHPRRVGSARRAHVGRRAVPFCGLYVGALARFVVVGVGEVRPGIDRAGGNGCERLVATLAEGDVSASAVGRIVRGMAIIGGHGMPKRAPC